jgi:gliding motility-associated-like protein
LARFLKNDSSFIDFITNLNQRPNYCYRILAFKELVSGEPQVISVSNEDCSPVRSKIFYPNAFTPNGDNLNDRYVTPSEYIKEYQIMIFNRWGEKVYESYDLTQNWDGTYQGKEAQMDAYAVVVVTTGVDNIRRVHHGTITLLR